MSLPLFRVNDLIKLITNFRKDPENILNSHILKVRTLCGQVYSAGDRFQAYRTVNYELNLGVVSAQRNFLTRAALWERNCEPQNSLPSIDSAINQKQNTICHCNSNWIFTWHIYVQNIIIIYAVYTGFTLAFSIFIFKILKLNSSSMGQEMLLIFIDVNVSAKIRTAVILILRSRKAWLPCYIFF